MLKKWQDLEIGGINFNTRNSFKNNLKYLETGKKPEFNHELCKNCFLCWVFCPDNAIIVENNMIKGINYDFCKGCGICIIECPVTGVHQPLYIKNDESES
jgi:pyruvate ferredoxin oxidoreductase delta subunit